MVLSAVISDGTGQELAEGHLFLVERENGQVIALDPYSLFYDEPAGDFANYVDESDFRLKSRANVHAVTLKKRFQAKRDPQSKKIATFLRASFQQQYEDILERRRSIRGLNLKAKRALAFRIYRKTLLSIASLKKRWFAFPVTKGISLVKKLSVNYAMYLPSFRRCPCTICLWMPPM